ncbi:stage V sporulation T C-terminal domain-containing protein [Bacilliculturomica massiliensis]|uniref:stage V sporulation T C-terminal domain-containing protein n=1 Tax=Bacilliculturomica massiliensis TaxID=1917867 RepID=UPI001031EF88|nr:stage V sporulation T C-terminal domain-containing protein [Bacilliculturomica massiliensis]
MKATGIVRRIDDLGRVVIPKEIRRTLRIREGDPLEIFTDREGEVILKKYSPIGELNEFAAEYAEAAAAILECAVAVTDTDQVIAFSGGPKKEYLEKRVNPAIEQVMKEKKTQRFKGVTRLESIIFDDVPGADHPEQVVVPVVVQGDCIGTVIFMAKRGTFDDTTVKTAEIGADFLARQMDN